MVRQAAERVTDYLEDKIGEGLRTVVIVEPDDFEISYLDEALKRRYSQDSFSQVVDTFRLERPFLDPDIDDLPVGERRAIVHYHENAFVLQFPFSETETILISVTREVGRDLLGFIETCRQLVQEESGR